MNLIFSEYIQNQYDFHIRIILFIITLNEIDNWILI